MQTQIQKVESAAVAEYSALLGARTPDERAAQILSLIRGALGRRRALSGFVRLALCAEDFGIHRDVRFAPLSHDGELEYSKADRKFFIYLSERYRRSAASERQDRLYGDDGGTELRGRARFTYAHEFCHRFFFAELQGGWVRAAAAVTKRRPGVPDGALLFKTLTDIEERICNRLAGDILLPSDELLSRLRHLEICPAWAAEADLGEILSAVSRDFLVSRECAFVRLERVVREKAIATGPGLVALRLSWSGRKGQSGPGSSGRSRSAIRVTSSVWPDTVSGLEIRGLYPGIAAANLGDDLLNFAQSKLAADISEGPNGTVDLQVSLHPRGGADLARHLKARLRGRWTSSHGPQNFRIPSLFIWGRLEITEA